MKGLTKAEEQIMQVLWRLKEAFIKDIINEMTEPKPAYNTVGTFLKILERKHFVSRKSLVTPLYILQIFKRKLIPKTL